MHLPNFNACRVLARRRRPIQLVSTLLLRYQEMDRSSGFPAAPGLLSVHASAHPIKLVATQDAAGVASGYWIELIKLAWGANWTATAIRYSDHREILFVNHLLHRPGLLRGDCQDRLRWLAGVRQGLQKHSHMTLMLLIHDHESSMMNDSGLLAHRLFRSHMRTEGLLLTYPIKHARTASCIQ